MLSNPQVVNLLTIVVEKEENLPIVKCLMDGVDTDEEIAEKTEIRLNIVRKILYKLYDEGLASYKRSKDPETQWYTYAWVFETDEVEKQLRSRSLSMIANLESMLENEENNMFFTCSENHMRFDFEQASILDFLCPECGEEIKFEDNAKIITKIKDEISLYQKTYDSINLSK